MAEIVLTTLNAHYRHTAFGLRYLYANLSELREKAVIREFGITDRTEEIAEELLAESPRIIGIGVYIWNVACCTRLVALIKAVAPEVIIVIGGPEVSYESEELEIVRAADYLVRGEADLAFVELCRALLAGDTPAKVINAALPNPASLQFPYSYYSDSDIERRLIYVEASRGCPFRCEYCLSSLDIPVRKFETAAFLNEMQKLIDRGARQFKFVDRTFNLNVRVGSAILTFFLERIDLGLFLHFEMVPDHFPPGLKEIITRFPPGTLQFEVGVQTLNPEVEKLISRVQDHAKLSENLMFLRNQTSAHIHADLIAGLPGESLQSLAAGFDQLLALNPQEIQLGLLKRLRGTPIVRHTAQYELNFAPFAPYQIISTSLLDFPTMQRISRFSRFWDLVANSGNFPRCAEAICRSDSSPFFAFLAFSDWIYLRLGRRSAIAMRNLAAGLFAYLVEKLAMPQSHAARLVADDYCRDGRSDLPPEVSMLVERGPQSSPALSMRSKVLPPRQRRHLAHEEVQRK